MDMLAVDSVMQLLRVRNNVYCQEMRVTRISDAAGFRPISPTIDELAVELELANYKDGPAFVAGPLRSRLQLILNVAEKHAQEDAEVASIQDRRMTDKVLADVYSDDQRSITIYKHRSTAVTKISLHCQNIAFMNVHLILVRLCVLLQTVKVPH
eukprot:6204982-Pleurochrysis_carterae.AAC.1